MLPGEGEKLVAHTFIGIKVGEWIHVNYYQKRLWSSSMSTNFFFMVWC